jgi:hypothetical protein
VGGIQDGETVTLNINYAAGHNSANNRFRMAYACGDTSQNAVEAASAQLSETTNGCTSTTAGQASTYDISDGGVNAANAIVTGGYQITCTVPTQGIGVGQTEECTLAIIDQRDWGGCVDVLVSSAAVPTPAPTPAPLMSNTGSYAIRLADMVDSSAADFTCCALIGSLAVPSYRAAPIEPEPSADPPAPALVHARLDSC